MKTKKRFFLMIYLLVGCSIHSINAQWSNTTGGITYNNAVGIGTSVLSNNKLSIHNAVSNTTVVRISNQTSGSSNGLLLKAIGRNAIIDNPAFGDLHFAVGPSLAGGSSKRMTIKSDGKIGIGTINPTSILDVAGKVSATQLQVSGNLGVGTGNPSSKLEVLGTIKSSSGANFINMLHDGSNAHIGSSKGNIMLGFYTGQDVVIGNPSSAASNLVIYGNINGACLIQAKEILVNDQFGWCDYVFDTDYSLMPIPQLKTFIEVNHHLPNIPSAKEVEKDGLNLAAMQRRMMEKIEELTLYVIAQEDKISSLQEEVFDLKQSK